MLIVVFDTLYSFFAGIAVFAIIGYLSATGFPLKSPGGLENLFISIPNAIAANSESPNFWSFCFFMSLFFFSIDTQMSWIETVATILHDVPKIAVKFKRWMIVFAICIIGIVYSSLYIGNWGYTHRSVINGGSQGSMIMMLGLLNVSAISWVHKIERTK